MLTINFTYNWNNKLDCDFCTTIRLSSIHNVDDIVLIKCHNRLTDTAKVIFKITTKLDKLTELVCRHDTGYSRDITINLIKKMYKGITDWNKQDIVIYGLDFKYKEKEITLIDSLHEDGVINKNNPKQSDQFLIDFLELSNK